MATTSDLYTRRDVEKRLRVGRASVVKLILGGDFPNAAKVGWVWRVPKSDVDAYLASRRVGGPKPAKRNTAAGRKAVAR